MQKTTFTTFEIVKKLRIERGCLREWIERGYIKPSIQTASGVGTKNLFSRLDLYQIKFFQSLLSRGLSRAEAARCADMVSYSGIKFIESCMSKKDSKYYNKPHPYPIFAIISHRTNDKGKNNPFSQFIFDLNEKKLVLKKVDDEDYILVLNLTRLREKVDSVFQLTNADNLRDLLK